MSMLARLLRGEQPTYESDIAQLLAEGQQAGLQQGPRAVPIGLPTNALAMGPGKVGVMAPRGASAPPGQQGSPAPAAFTAEDLDWMSQHGIKPEQYRAMLPGQPTQQPTQTRQAPAGASLVDQYQQLRQQLEKDYASAREPGLPIATIQELRGTGWTYTAQPDGSLVRGHQSLYGPASIPGTPEHAEWWRQMNQARARRSAIEAALKGLGPMSQVLGQQIQADAQTNALRDQGLNAFIGQTLAQGRTPSPEEITNFIKTSASAQELMREQKKIGVQGAGGGQPGVRSQGPSQAEERLRQNAQEAQNIRNQRAPDPALIGILSMLQGQAAAPGAQVPPYSVELLADMLANEGRLLSDPEARAKIRAAYRARNAGGVNAKEIQEKIADIASRIGESRAYGPINVQALGAPFPAGLSRGAELSGQGDYLNGSYNFQPFMMPYGEDAKQRAIIKATALANLLKALE